MNYLLTICTNGNHTSGDHTSGGPPVVKCAAEKGKKIEPKQPCMSSNTGCLQTTGNESVEPTNTSHMLIPKTGWRRFDKYLGHVHVWYTCTVRPRY